MWFAVWRFQSLRARMEQRDAALMQQVGRVILAAGKYPRHP